MLEAYILKWIEHFPMAKVMKPKTELMQVEVV